MSQPNTLEKLIFADLIGLKLADKYEIQSFMGEGGMSLVFNAYDHALDRQVTVKVIKPGYTFSPRAFDAFVAEMRTIPSCQALLSVNVSRPDGSNHETPAYFFQARTKAMNLSQVTSSS